MICYLDGLASTNVDPLINNCFLLGGNVNLYFKPSLLQLPYIPDN